MEAERQDESQFRAGGVVIVVGTILLSLIVPLTILGWNIHRFIATLPFWMPFKESTWIGGDGNSLRDGELWYTAISESRVPGASAFRLKRFNLETRTEFETGIQFTDEMAWPIIASANDLYVISHTSIKKVEGDSLKLLDNRSQDSASIEFTYDGRLTEIRKTDDGGYCLFHLGSDGWRPGRRIRLPSPNSTRTIDPSTGKPQLVADGEPLEQQEGNPQRRYAAEVLARGDQLYIVSYCRGFAALRLGFEFVDEPPSTASALEPDNTRQLYSGWEPIPSIVGDRDLSRYQVSSYGCDEDGFLVVLRSNDGKIRLIRRRANGRWINVIGMEEHRFDSSYPRFLVDVARRGTYIVVNAFVDEGYAVLHRIDGNRLLADPIVIRSVFDAYFNRWRRLIGAAVGAWVLHWLVIGIGVVCLIRYASPIHTPDLVGMEPASCVQQVLAKLVDVSLFMAIPAAEVYTYFHDFSFIRNIREQIDLKWNFLQSIEAGQFLYLHETRFMKSVFAQLEERRASLGFLVATLITLLFAASYVEGRYGLTFGKWLFGLRTVRTTGRRCGFARALLRTLMLAIDFLLLLTPIPLFISLAFSDKLQRCGDRLADTVVVRFPATTRPQQGTAG